MQSEAKPATRAGRSGATTSFARINRSRPASWTSATPKTGRTTAHLWCCCIGWPYDIHSYVDVAPQLAARGYRVLVPHLRGYGTTRFLSP
jgi:pimeloyl-ACP methyl ester carboxylesterase